jgi:hypothetical protein
MIAVLGVCGAVIVGFAFWNYRLSGKNDELLEQNRRLEVEVERLLERNERLLDDVTHLAAQVPKHDSLGRFKKKASQR